MMSTRFHQQIFSRLLCLQFFFFKLLVCSTYQFSFVLIIFCDFVFLSNILSLFLFVILLFIYLQFPFVLTVPNTKETHNLFNFSLVSIMKYFNEKKILQARGKGGKET